MSGPGIGVHRAAPDPLRDAYENRPTAPVEGREHQGSAMMLGQLHEELARTRHREACIQARRLRLLRAARAQRRARRAVDLAVRANELAHVQGVGSRV
ncbi:MAG TPA: hypothetical protein VI248_11645 [Kineosporiaceae bacterium]